MIQDDVFNEIRNISEVIKKDSIIKNTAIRDGIFGILENRCNVIYYPIPNEKNRGFHIKRIVNDKLEDFVYINTDKPVSEQIFAAAHEFGHICEVADRVWRDLDLEGKPTVEEEEKITDWFAAEFLMPTNEFRNIFFAHVKELDVKNNMIRLDGLIQIIVLIMNDFMVPYESVRRRLVETKIINKKDADLLILDKDIAKIVGLYTKDKNTYMENDTGVKTISGIRTLIENAENKSDIDIGLVNKIKKDFEIEDMTLNKERLQIHIGDGDND